MKRKICAAFAAAGLLSGGWAVNDAIAQGGNTTSSCHHWDFEGSSFLRDVGMTGGKHGSNPVNVRRIPGADGQASSGLRLDGYWWYPGSVDFPKEVANLGTADFELSFHLRGSTTGYDYDILGNRTQGGMGDFLSVRAVRNGAATVELGEADGSTYTSVSTGVRVIDGRWHHLRIRRTGDVTSVYVDGRLRGQGRSRNGQPTDLRSANPFRLGRSYQGYRSALLDFDEVSLRPVTSHSCVSGARADRYTAIEDEPLVVHGGGVLRNDVHKGGLHYTSVRVLTRPELGRVSMKPTGDVAFTPHRDRCGTDHFTYSAADEHGFWSQPVTVVVDIRCVNDAPVADDLVLHTVEDTPASGTITASDVDGDALEFSLDAAPGHGRAEVGRAGEVHYAPDADWFGTDSFTVQVTDGNGGVASSEVVVEVAEAPMIETNLTADPVSTVGADPLAEGADLSATLTDADGHTLAGRTLTFSVGERVLCDAVTDADGVGRCHPTADGLAEVIVDEGYDVEFRGGPDHLPAQGRGTLA